MTNIIFTSRARFTRTFPRQITKLRTSSVNTLISATIATDFSTFTYHLTASEMPTSTEAAPSGKRQHQRDSDTSREEPIFKRHNIMQTQAADETEIPRSSQFTRSTAEAKFVNNDVSFEQAAALTMQIGPLRISTMPMYFRRTSAS